MKKIISLLLTLALCTALAVSVSANELDAVVKVNNSEYYVNDGDWEQAFDAISALDGHSSVKITYFHDVAAPLPALDGDLEIDFALDLCGNTLTVTSDWCVQTAGNITIVGGDGTIQFAQGVKPSGLFCMYGDGLIKVSNTKFFACQCGRYPLFYTECNQSGRIEFENCGFWSCSSSAYGGVVYAYQLKKIDLKNTFFYRCSSEYGGVFYLEDCSPASNDSRPVCLIECTDCEDILFDECFAYDGGAVYLDNSRLEIRLPNGAAIEKCTADHCGGVFFCGSDSMITITAGENMGPDRARISECKADGYGGVGYSKGSVFLNCLDIESCWAADTGVLYMNNDDHAQLDNCHISECWADENANVLYLSGNVDTFWCWIHQCEFRDKADNQGNLPMLVSKAGHLRCENPPSTLYSNNPNAINNSGSHSLDRMTQLRLDGSQMGSVLSEGNMTIVLCIACAVVFGIGGFILGTKKKKPALANSAEKEDKE